MTDLEQARAHLLLTQDYLRAARSLGDEINNRVVCQYEDAFLAALSWVWEEQGKARSDRALNEIQVWYDSHLGAQPYEYERGKEITELRHLLGCVVRGMDE